MYAWPEIAKVRFPRFTSAMSEYLPSASADEFQTRLVQLRIEAPDAWLHRLYAPLSSQGLADAEVRLGEALPSSLRHFLSAWNGMTLFFVSFELWGNKHFNHKVPFDMVERNAAIAAQDELRQNSLAFGNYGFGRLLCMDRFSEEVFTWEGRKSHLTWPSLDDALLHLVREGKESGSQE